MVRLCKSIARVYGVTVADNTCTEQSYTYKEGVSSLKSMVKLISWFKGMDSCFRRNDSYRLFPSLSFLA